MATSGGYKNERRTYETKTLTIKPFPTSPIPRQSLGNIAVRVLPPKRDGLNLDEDYIIPENHMVFVRATTKRSSGYGSAGSSRSRVAAVSNAFSNWHNRYGTHPNDPDDRTDNIRFAGVSYEGIMDAKAAKSHPDQKGRLTVTVNGVVSIYCRADDLADAVLGDKLEWVPCGSNMSWRQLGTKFEPCRIRKYDPAKYQPDKKAFTVKKDVRDAFYKTPPTQSSFAPHIDTSAFLDDSLLSTFASMTDSVGVNAFTDAKSLKTLSRADKLSMVDNLDYETPADFALRNVIESGFSSCEADSILPGFSTSVGFLTYRDPSSFKVLQDTGVVTGTHGKFKLNLDNMFTTQGAMKPGVDDAYTKMAHNMNCKATSRITSYLKTAMKNHHKTAGSFDTEPGAFSRHFVSPSGSAVDATRVIKTIDDASNAFVSVAREFDYGAAPYDLYDVTRATSGLFSAVDKSLREHGASVDMLINEVNGTPMSPSDSRSLQGALSKLGDRGIKTSSLLGNFRKVNALIKNPDVMAFARNNSSVMDANEKSSIAAVADLSSSVQAYMDAKDIATDTSGLLSPYFDATRSGSIDRTTTASYLGEALRGLAESGSSDFAGVYPTSDDFSGYTTMCALGMGVGAVGVPNAEKYFDPSIGKINFKTSYDTAMSMLPTSSDFSTTKFVTDRNANSVMASCLLSAAHGSPRQADKILGEFSFTKVATKSRMSPVNVVFGDKDAAETYANHNSHPTIGDISRNANGDFVVRFEPISTSSHFSDWFSGHKTHGSSAKAVFTDELAKTMTDLRRVSAENTETALRTREQLYNKRFGGLDGNTSQLAAMMHDETSAITSGDMTSTFGKFFVGNRATNPCHSLDNPYLLVHAALPSDAMIECSTEGAILPNSIECITSSDFSSLASDTKMMKVVRSLRPTNTMTPLLVATSALSDSPTTSGKIVHAFVANHEDTQAPLFSVSTSMEMAKKLLSPEDYRSRAMKVGKLSVASKNNLLGGFGSSMYEDASHISTSSNQNMKLAYGKPDPKRKDDAEAFLRPNERVFGVLLDKNVEANTIRVMLNPALSV